MSVTDERSAKIAQQKQYQRELEMQMAQKQAANESQQVNEYR